MAGLAPGGHSPVLTLSMMGVSALVLGPSSTRSPVWCRSLAWAASWPPSSWATFGETPTDRFLVHPVSWSLLPTVMSCFCEENAQPAAGPARKRWTAVVASPTR